MSPSDYCNKNNRLWSTNIIYCYCRLINGHCVGSTCICIATRKLRDDGWGHRTLPCYLQPAINNVLQAVAHCPSSVLFGSIDRKMCFKLKTNVTETIKSALVFFFFGQLMFVCKTCVGDGSGILSATAPEQTK